MSKISGVRETGSYYGEGLVCSNNRGQNIWQNAGKADKNSKR